MRYLIVRTDVRRLAAGELADALSRGHQIRDELKSPEVRRQTVTAEDRESALHLARALASHGGVRSGRQRVKVLRMDFVDTGPPEY
ncbi:MAG TPA: hypothetical protein VJT31_00615 [Rugosimonospora sp.]|nr:hypothetical protein [Rugosimonospora sp.]